MDKTFNYLLERDTNLLLKYLSTLSQAQEQKGLGILVNYYNGKEYFSHSIEIANLLLEPKRSSSLENILKSLLIKGTLEDIQKVSTLLSRDLSRDELRTFYGQTLAKEVHYMGSTLVPVADMLPEPDRTRELEKLLVKYIDRGNLENSGKVAALLGRPLTKFELESIIEFNIEKAFVKDAEEACKLVGRELTSTELEKALAVTIRGGNTGHALEISRHLNRPLTEAEINSIFENAISWSDYHPGVHAQMVDAAELFPESSRRERFLEILSVYEQKGVHFTSDALKIAVKLSEPQRSVALTDIYDRCIEKREYRNALSTINLFPNPMREVMLRKALRSAVANEHLSDIEALIKALVSNREPTTV